MKRITILGFLAASLLLSGLPARTQDKSPKDETKAVSLRQDGPQLKVQIVFAEYEGEKKIKSLPYTVLVLVGGDTNWSKIRMGDRVPIATGKDTGGGIQFQYIDVGTNIDCRAFAASEGRFRLLMNLERSWVQSDMADPAAKVMASADKEFHEPTIRQFRTDSSVILRDGQTIETNFATDPTSGKVIKLEVSMTVLK